VPENLERKHGLRAADATFATDAVLYVSAARGVRTAPHFRESAGSRRFAGRLLDCGPGPEHMELPSLVATSLTALGKAELEPEEERCIY